MTTEANGEPTKATAITHPSETGTLSIYPPGCHVCGGMGIVYGLDGKPYLCPKCGGDGATPYSPWYQQVWCNTTATVSTATYDNYHTISYTPILV